MSETGIWWQDWYSGDYWSKASGVVSADEMELNVWYQSDHEPAPADPSTSSNNAPDESEYDEPDPEWTPGAYWLPIFFGRGNGKGRKGKKGGRFKLPRK